MRRPTYHTVIAAVLFLGLSAGARARAQADEDPAARARALFAEGVTQVEAREFGAAEERFRAALALRDAPAIRYNLASVLFEQGELPEAYALTSSAAADETASAEIREHARTLAAQIESGAGYLDVETGGLWVALTVDGYEVPGLERPVPVAAGALHTVVGRVEGVERLREEIRVAAGEHHEVSFAALAAPVDEGEPTPAAGGEVPLEENPFLWVGVGAGAAVVLGVVIGAAVASSGTEAPVEGNFMPGVLRW